LQSYTSPSYRYKAAPAGVPDVLEAGPVNFPTDPPAWLVDRHFETGHGR